MDEGVVWLLTLAASIEAAILLQYLSRLQTVHAQTIGANGVEDFVMWHQLEAWTGIERVLLRLTQYAGGERLGGDTCNEGRGTLAERRLLGWVWSLGNADFRSLSARRCCWTM